MQPTTTLDPYLKPTESETYELLVFGLDGAIVESMKAGSYYETACDDHALYVEVYGDDSNVVTVDNRTGRIVLANFLNMRQAAPYQPHIDPNAGMLASLCVAESSFGGQLVDVRRAGKEIVFALGKSKDTEVFTKRQNDRYYKKGGDIGKTSFLMLGVAESFSPPEL